MKAVSTEEMKAIEKAAIFDIGIPSIVLMEMAAFKFAQKCFDFICANGYSKIVVFAGKGNNGGDGLAFCRHICQMAGKNFKIEVSVFFIGDKNLASYECGMELSILLKFIEEGFPVCIDFVDNPDFNDDIVDKAMDADLIVDAIIGTGLKYNVRDNISNIIDIINNSNATVAAVDCPTGIDADNGKVLGNAVVADFTVTFHLPKIGLLINQGPIYSGELFIEDINIPYGQEKNVNVNYLSTNDAGDIVPKRPLNANKGSFGKVFVFAGCNNMPGACVISSKAAYRAGAGLVYSCSTKAVCGVVRNHIPEAVTKTLVDKDGYLFSESIEGLDFKDADCIVLGPGLGNNSDTAGFVREVVEKARAPIVIDADAINIISENLSLFSQIKVPCVITPHLGEMSRLINKSIDDIKNNIVEEAREFSKKYGITVLLKDFRSVISSPSGEIYINTTGSSALAKGGSGDCLTGIIAAFIAQGMDCFHAGALASFVFGLSGKKAAEKFGEFGPLATECSDFVSIILNELR